MEAQDYFKRQNMMVSPNAAKLIKTLKILVVGAGAGGNEVLKNLLLMGFGNITIVDFDTVEDSNLSRTTLFRKEDIGKSKSLVAAQRLKEMALHENPNIKGLHGNLMTDFGKGLFIDHDIVICCVDTQKCRAYINDWCVRTKTPFFEMGFAEYDVDICFFAPEGTMTQSDGTIIEKLPSNNGVFPTFNGDFPVCLREEIGFGNFEEKRNSCSGYKVKDVNLAKIPTIQVSAAMAGVLVATELIKYLDGKDRIRNKMLLYFGLTYETMICSYNRNPKCVIHDEQVDIITHRSNENETIGELINKLEQELGGNILLTLPDEFIISGKCHICGKTILYNKRRSEVWDEERWCDDCKSKYENYEHIIEYASDIVKIPKEITSNSPQYILSKKLNDVGVPQNDILSVMHIVNKDCKNIFLYLKTEKS